MAGLNRSKTYEEFINPWSRRLGHMIKETAQALGYEEIVFLDDMVKEDDVIGMCCDYVIKHEDYPVAVAAFGNNKTASVLDE